MGTDSLVFVDDNPAEREIINQDLPEVSTPNISEVYKYIQTIDHNGYFEVISLSKEDLKKNEMYKENMQRTELMESFDNYDVIEINSREYLLL